MTDQIPTASSEAEPTSTVRAPGQLPALTGLRGIAVLSVIAYHLHFVPGGFVGVDVFFVLSGFLITSLLLDETPSDVPEMLRWWGRRIRRLSPAVAVVVLVVLLAFLTRSGIALDSFATLTWWQNWHLIAEGTPYWAGSPSPLRHTWSLSIEEQFYLLWPPILVVTLLLARRLRRPSMAVATVAVTGAVASFCWAAWLATRTSPNLSRIYFGTDTRAGALLIGCAAAAMMYRKRRRSAGRSRFSVAPAVFSRLALPAAATLVALAILMEPSDRWAYTGGLALAAASSLTLVLAGTRQGALSSAMSPAAVQWLGTRSYALYLWSWPIQIFLESHFESLGRIWVAVITLALSFPLADLSMRLIEEPLRRGSFWATAALPRRAAWSIGTLALVVTMLIAANSTELTVDETVAKDFERQADPTVPATTTTCPPAPTTSAPQFTDDTVEFDQATVAEATDPTTLTCGELLRVLVVGDSTGRGAANGLRRVEPPGVQIWDRTELGCGLVVDDPDCPDWRALWREAVDTIDPDIVLVHLGVSDDLVAGDDPDFLSDEARTLRQREIVSAIELLGSGGAKVAWILPAVPLDRGTFYCGGERNDSPCDPDWVARWNEDVGVVTAATGARAIDVNNWVITRGSTSVDRPDGLHLSGPALDAQAEWLAQQLR